MPNIGKPQIIDVRTDGQLNGWRINLARVEVALHKSGNPVLYGANWDGVEFHLVLTPKAAESLVEKLKGAIKGCS